ncbi:MAG TPA: hypothetical protein ENJ35_03320 [Gammaproteobacteria bacterium]|nr:hypothetical protein [Gammaproteobacteria bacterium]
MKYLFTLILLLFFLPGIGQADDQDYPWLSHQAVVDTITSRFLPPAGFKRTAESVGSFGDWLRHLPLKAEGTPVRMYNGALKYNRDAYCAVIDIDTGKRDLQQCADAVIRLRAEYLFSRTDFSHIRFNFTSGDPASYQQWRQGYRPIIRGNHVSWKHSTGEDDSYQTFRQYLDSVFTYAGSWSLSRELRPRHSVRNIHIGDVFIKGGFPGHAVIVVDMATRPETGEKVFLLAQSYMPAQDIHILQNPNRNDDSPWYSIPRGHQLKTPEWTFKTTELMTFGDPQASRISSTRKMIQSAPGS